MRTRAGSGAEGIYDQGVMASNIPEMIVMIRHIFMTDSPTVLRPVLTADMPADASPVAGARVGAA